MQRDHQKKCYELCVYESVDDQNTSYITSHKSLEFRTQEPKGYND